MTRPTDAEVLAIALEPDIELEFQRVLRMSDEEIRQSLIARGHDLRVLEAEADVLWSMFQPQKKKLRRGYIAGAIGLVGSGAAAAAALLGPFAEAAAPIVSLAASAPPATPEEALREEAFVACKNARWQLCLDKLDQARAIDSYGETRGEVVDARKLAEQNLAEGGKR